MEVTQAPVSPSQAEALDELCAEVQGAFSKGEVKPAAIRAGLAVARELTDRLRAGSTPGARSQSSWSAFMVRRPDGGASLVLEDSAKGHALELRLAATGRFTGAALRGGGGEAELLAFRVTASAGGFALGVSDGGRVVESDLGRDRVLPFTAEPGVDPHTPFAAVLGGLLSVGGETEVIPTRPARATPREKKSVTRTSATSAGWILRVTAGPSAGTRFRLSDGAVLGRAKDAAIHLDVKSVSRRHAELRRSGTVWTIADLGSSNGTWVNGSQVTSPAPLKLSDQVQVGEVVMLVETEVPPDEMSEAPTALNMPLQKR